MEPDSLNRQKPARYLYQMEAGKKRESKAPLGPSSPLNNYNGYEILSLLQALTLQALHVPTTNLADGHYYNPYLYIKELWLREVKCLIRTAREGWSQDLSPCLSIPKLGL